MLYIYIGVSIYVYLTLGSIIHPIIHKYDDTFPLEVSLMIWPIITPCFVLGKSLSNLPEILVAASKTGAFTMAFKFLMHLLVGTIGFLCYPHKKTKMLLYPEEKPTELPMAIARESQ